jgi:hemerythrin
MSFMTWNENLSVGVRVLDDQHTVLIETLNDLHAAMMKGQARAIAGKLLHSLVEYTRDHFVAEEQMMAATKYPGLAEHRIQHESLGKQVEEFVGRYERGDITISVHLLNFLSEWLTNHIQGDDRKYGPWLNEHGVR